MTTAYIDASALVKLVLDEPDGIAMRHWYHEHERVASSRIGIIESRRAVRRKVDDPAHIEAIHLASALALGNEVDAFVTYDGRLADAARAIGLPVVRPGG